MSEQTSQTRRVLATTPNGPIVEGEFVHYNGSDLRRWGLYTVTGKVAGRLVMDNGVTWLRNVQVSSVKPCDEHCDCPTAVARRTPQPPSCTPTNLCLSCRLGEPELCFNVI